MTHVLPPLPFGSTDLEPYISAETLSFHHGKHHQAYVTKLNELLDGHTLQDASLEEVILQSAKKAEMAAIFNNAAQIWNHTFYWNCMKQNGGGKPSGAFLTKIEESFGTYDNFCIEFTNACITQFGSGWAWLVVDENDKLSIMKTSNADTPMVHGKTALLTCDVWEHAYYIDFRNRRPDYVKTFLEHLVNWEFVTRVYGQ